MLGGSGSWFTYVSLNVWGVAGLPGNMSLANIALFSSFVDAIIGGAKGSATELSLRVGILVLPPSDPPLEIYQFAIQTSL